MLSDDERAELEEYRLKKRLDKELQNIVDHWEWHHQPTFTSDWAVESIVFGYAPGDAQFLECITDQGRWLQSRAEKMITVYYEVTKKDAEMEFDCPSQKQELRDILDEIEEKKRMVIIWFNQTCAPCKLELPSDYTVECTNCGWQGYDEYNGDEKDLVMFEDKDGFGKGCPECKTDAHLMDTEHDWFQ